jgi:iron(III) transport system substrate-binding protein
MLSMNIKAVLGILLTATELFAFALPIHAQTAGEVLKVYESLKNPERRSRLTEGARKEGNLVFYGTLGVDASRPLLEKFRQAHPYVSIGHYRSGSTGIYNRVVNEARAGKHEVDIIELSAGPVSDLIRAGLVDPYRSPETDSMRAEFIDPRHLWSAYHYLVVGLAYNKKLVKASEVPKTYADLLLPRWKGRKMSLDRDAGDIFGALLDSWGEKEGIEYFRRLAKQDILIRSGFTLQALSEDGQTFMGIDLVRSPVRVGQKQKYTELGRPKTKVITPEFLGQNYERYSKIYHEIFAVR